MSYISPINTRYKAPVMSKLWSSDSKIIKMRQLWIDLATYQKWLGVDIITDEGISEMTQNIENIDYDKINKYELEFKHDIMAHIYAFSDLCPTGKNMIHLGATSNFINDNVDMIIIQKSIHQIIAMMEPLNMVLKQNALFYGKTPTLAYTHLQPAQLITVGKRFAIWHSDILMDYKDIIELYKNLPFRGIKGTVGTEDTLMKLFDNDVEKCELLNTSLANKYNFTNKVKICGQTYSRKYDLLVVQKLSSLCQSIYKMMNDIRLLSGKKEIYEDFQKKQIGSSAMPYKKNPITCEKICSLCRLVINHENNMSQTYMNQWLERSLDDSAIKRVVFPECFMLVEHIINETTKCIQKLFINTKQINRNIESHLPNILSEQIIISGVKMGYNRQVIHEELRVLLLDDDDNQVNLFNIDKEGFEIVKDIIASSQISGNPMDYIGRCVDQINTFYKRS